MLQIKDIYKRYKTGDFVQTALNGVSLTLRDNEFVAILGPSGSGKTTLLNIIGGLDRYDSGDLIINGISTKKYKDRDWDAYRNHTIGFVFQSYNLIPHQTVLSNVELALTLSGVSASEKKKRAEKALIKVGLGDHMHKKPNQMSGGQMQRVAIARALVNEPDIILADEPTGALDSETSVQIMELLKEVAKDKLVVMVTHNPELADQYANRIVRVKDGNIIADTNPVPVAALTATHQTMKWTHLGFATALGLSMNNLMTKKGRTLLTAFAGAIGIIGIASILSLSNGVNDYIKDLENDMLGSYPLEIDRSAYDLTSMMSLRQERIEEMSADKSDRDDSLIYSNNVVADALSATQSLIKENNLARFKLYLDSHMDELENAVSAVEYSYDVSPYVFRKDGEDIVKVSPGSLIDTSGSRMLSYSLNASWTQLVSSQSLLEKQYELLAGDWPDAPDEIAVVLTSDNELSDYTLYAIGAMELNKLNDLVDAISDDEEYEDPEETFTYEDILGKEFKVFSPSQMYVFSEVSSDGSGTEDENSDSENSGSENSGSEKSDSKKSGSENSASKTFSFLNKSEEDAEVYSAWLDKSDDDDYIASIYESGFSCKITCILRATEDAAISSGLAYDKSLTYKLLEVAKESDVVKEQMANPEINVLTGKPFVEEDEEDTEDMDGDENPDGADAENSESDDSVSANGAAGSNASGANASGSIAYATASATSGANTLTHIPSHKVLASAVSDSTSNASIREAAAGSYLLAANDANTSTTEASGTEAGGPEEATSETTDSSVEESTEGNGSSEENSKAEDPTKASESESSATTETQDTAESSKAQETSQASESSAAEEGDKGSESSASEESSKPSESTASQETTKTSETPAENETSAAGGIGSSETSGANESSATNGSSGSNESSSANGSSGSNESSSANGSSGSNESSSANGSSGFNESSSSANESSEADSSNGNASEGGAETPSGPDLSFDSLTAEQLAALLETITGSEPGTILPEQVSAAMSAIAAADLQNMTVTDLVKIISQASGQDFNVSIPVTPDQMEELTASILDSLSPDQMTALTKYLMDNVSEEQMTALMAGVMGNLTDSQMNGLMAAVLGSLSEEQMAGLMQNMYGNLTDEQIKALMGNSDFSSLFSNLTEAQMQAMMAQVMGNLTDDQIAALIGQSMGSLTQEQLAALMGGMDLSSMLGSLSKEQLAALMGGMDISSIFSNMTQEELMALLGDQLADNLDWEQLLKDAGYDLESLYGTGSMSDDMLAVLMARMSGSTPSSYEEVLEALGYCDLEDPSTIYIYPTDFDGKGVVEDMIERYNNEAVDEKDQVTYTDLIATISSSITSIIDTISYVLIAFVSISLIVSSIMIAIITYISVLERTKEIGVLRALGASKNDVSRIFNAETFIEGLISGIIGIVVTVLLCIPVNRIVYDWQGIERIAVLPPVAGVILIAISVILTLIAGFAPSRMASKKDPVLALRSE